MCLPELEPPTPLQHKAFVVLFSVFCFCFNSLLFRLLFFNVSPGRKAVTNSVTQSVRPALLPPSATHTQWRLPVFPSSSTDVASRTGKGSLPLNKQALQRVCSQVFLRITMNLCCLTQLLQEGFFFFFSPSIKKKKKCKNPGFLLQLWCLCLYSSQHWLVDVRRKGSFEEKRLQAASARSHCSLVKEKNLHWANFSPEYYQSCIFKAKYEIKAMCKKFLGLISNTILLINV